MAAETVGSARVDLNVVPRSAPHQPTAVASQVFHCRISLRVAVSAKAPLPDVPGQVHDLLGRRPLRKDPVG